MRKISLLVVDDEPDVLSIYGEILSEHGYEVTTAESCEEARKRVKEEFFDLLLLDDRMSGMSGIDFLEECRHRYPGIGGIFITGHASMESAIRALRAGAIDLLPKPVEKETLLAAVHRALAGSQLVREQRYRHNGAGTHFDEIIGDSEALRKVQKRARQVIPTDVPVLLSGKTGTGKELLARAIHFEGPRKDKPFIPVVAAAIPVDLIESTLFGHKKGAFTGALADRKGVFEEANSGTVFLDEIGELTLAVQVKLLRVLQEKAITRLGENREIPVNVRVIAATNKDLESEVKAKRFREDLLYRLNVITIDLPPLRDRMEDIPALASHLVGIHYPKIGKPIKAISPDALDKLCRYSWPGNIRELENVVQRAIIFAEGETIMPQDIVLDRSSDSDIFLNLPFREAAENFGRLYFKELLIRAKGNKTEAAELAGLDRTVLYAHLKKLKLLTQDN